MRPLQHVQKVYHNYNMEIGHASEIFIAFIINMWCPSVLDL